MAHVLATTVHYALDGFLLACPDPEGGYKFGRGSYDVRVGPMFDGTPIAVPLDRHATYDDFRELCAVHAGILLGGNPEVVAVEPIRVHAYEVAAADLPAAAPSFLDI